jgi:hypothetical protein
MSKKFDSKTTVFNVNYYKENSNDNNEFGPFGDGDSKLFLNIGDESLMKDALRELKEEVPWSNMRNRGKLVLLCFYNLIVFMIILMLLEIGLKRERVKFQNLHLHFSQHIK